MKKFLFLSSILLSVSALAQPVEVEVFQKTATASTAQLGVRVRATSGTVDYMGVTFYILYQSANAAPQSTGANTVVGVDDSKLTTTYGWGTGSRFTNPAQVVNPAFDPAPAGGRTFDRRYVYGNSDDAGGANVRTLTTAWDTILYITLNTLQPTAPEGGYVYQQETSEAAGTALTDPGFSNIAINVTSSEVPLGLSALPITLTNFNANCVSRGISVNWQTATEVNSSLFEVEKSSNGTVWNSIGSVKGAGNSNTVKNYQFIDAQGGAAVYRLKQIDRDGKFTYSGAVSINCQTRTPLLFVYPVPAKNDLNVVLPSDKAENVTFQVSDLLGRIHQQQVIGVQKGTNNIQLNVRGLNSGEYFLRIIQGDKVTTQKIMIANQ